MLSERSFRLSNASTQACEQGANRRESAYGPSSTTRRSTTEDHQGGTQTVRCEGITRDDDSRARHRGGGQHRPDLRSEEHTSELQSLLRSSNAVFSLKKTKHT